MLVRLQETIQVTTHVYPYVRLPEHEVLLTQDYQQEIEAVPIPVQHSRVLQETIQVTMQETMQGTL
jgi:hypothetical protein